jgi:phytoene dehydrogenase-like protein
MEVVGSEGRFTLWTDRARWREEARCAFPVHHAPRERFFRWAEAIGGVVHRFAARRPVMPPLTPRDALRLAMALRPEVTRALPYLPRTAGGVMAGFGADRDAAFAQFVDAQLLDATGCEAATCAAVNGAIALDLYHRGCFALPGGPAEIARDLLRALRQDGGAIRFGTSVVGLRRDGSGLWRVRTSAGETFQTRTVISNAPAWDVPALLGSGGGRVLRRARRLRSHGWGAFVMHAAVDSAVLSASRHAHYQTLPPVGSGLAEGGMCFISVMAPSRRAGAPRAVSVSTHTDARRWWGLGREAYEDKKALYTERMLDACERAMPGFRRGLVFQQTATPRTFAHYTLRGGGVVGGVRNDRRHSTFGALSHRSGIPGLYLCGDSVFPGQGTIGVTLSGINAWRSVRDDLGVERARYRRGAWTGASEGHSSGDGRVQVA